MDIHQTNPATFFNRATGFLGIEIQNFEYETVVKNPTMIKNSVETVRNLSIERVPYFFPFPTLMQHNLTLAMPMLVANPGAKSIPSVHNMGMYVLLWTRSRTPAMS